MSQPDILTVSGLTALVKRVLEGEFGEVRVRGEMSNSKRHTSGHLYFTLKDEASVLKCVMFRAKALGLRFEPRDGMSVVASGRVSVYERDGQYQLYAEHLHPAGEGDLFLALEELKRRLEADGVFAPGRKRRLPKLPGRVGVVTSRTGAVLRDIVTVARRRFTGADLLLAAVPVQGYTAAPEIAAAIDSLNAVPGLTAIIVARGGGSIEELWPFNEEQVVRAVVRSRVPVVSAVGHATDVTLIDFAADMSAPTPSAAAELVFPDESELRRCLTDYRSSLEAAVRRRVELARSRLTALADRRVLQRPGERLDQLRQRVDELSWQLGSVLRACLAARRTRLAGVKGAFGALSPRATLARGYSICRARGQVLTRAGEVAVGEAVQVTLASGGLDCSVTRVKEGLFSE